MGGKAWERLGFVTMAVHVCICILIFIKWAVDGIPWGSLNPAWAGAIGTVTTLAWAIWLATAETRRRRREDKAKAMIAACFLLPTIGRVEAELFHLISILTDDSYRGYGIELSIHADKLVKCGTWTRDEILPLAHLENRPAAKLAAARSQIDHCIGVMQIQGARGINFKVSIKIYQEMAATLNAAREFLEAARTELTLVANIEG